MSLAKITISIQASTTMSRGGTGLQDKTQNYRKLLMDVSQGLELVYSEQFLMSKLSDVPQLSHT